MTDSGDPKLYHELAEWWPLLSPPSEYEEEAVVYLAHLRAAAERALVNVLELGSGGGNNASYLRRHFAMTLTDISPDMLEVSRRLNPECEHVQDDMRTLRLGRTFDAVFVHDAIAYMTTLDDLSAVMLTVAEHCAPGAAVVIAPDRVKETFTPYTDHGGSDGEGRALRYLEWTYDPDPTDSTCVTDFAYLMREGDYAWVEHDRHISGLFPRATWLAELERVGLKGRAETHRFSDDSFCEIFTATKS